MSEWCMNDLEGVLDVDMVRSFVTFECWLTKKNEKTKGLGTNFDSKTRDEEYLIDVLHGRRSGVNVCTRHIIRIEL
jgi:hypothetical protein